MNLEWEIKKFDEWSVSEMYAALQLRVNVFVVEQNCPYPDLDDKDVNAYHVVGWDGETCVAVARLLAPGVSYSDCSIGRVATHFSYRGKGIGRELMLVALAKMQEIFPNQNIRISAQSYLLAFYKSLGFEVVSEEYLEDDIPHYEMLLTKSP